jgi:molecular chaperone DnaK (HSP70)
LTHIYRTVFENQKCVTVQVFEGEHHYFKDNNFLGEFIVRDVLPLPAGQAKIKVTFSIDLNGILKASAVDLQTSNEMSIDINYGKGSLAGVESCSDFELPCPKKYSENSFN